MLFNSIEFLIFLPIVFALFWLIPKEHQKLRNIALLLASYLFYGWWDWRFLSLIVFSSFLDFFLGKAMASSKKLTVRKALLGISLLGNLGILGIFKYYNFFADSLAEILELMHFKADFVTLNVILPVGISFYTFQTLSYTIDVYRNKIEPTKDVLAFFAFVSFFPQLVAGPIERAKNLLPQFYTARVFSHNMAVDGMRQILWGMFKKVVVADNCAYFVDVIFSNPGDYNAPTLLLGSVLFAFQIYGDFSGYSDIAIGTARLFGFDLMRNFAYPYFSRDIAEFWRRWHISLSTWFRDYLYIPLGGSKGGIKMQIRNVFAIFLISGLWHGANWTFVVWGGLNALYFVPLMLAGKNRRFLEVVANDRLFPTSREFIQILVTFVLTCIAWVFFRAASVGDAINYLIGCFDPGNFKWNALSLDLFNLEMLKVASYIIVLSMVEWLQRSKEHGLESIKLNLVLRWATYIVIIIMVSEYFQKNNDFIYFQF
jgi:D-alanyl-lipoteichoic acid acyltransferase DltB (MBOAT superfamily)